MIAHSTSKRIAKALPQVESTVLIEGIDKKVLKCRARAAFKIGNSNIVEGETFYLVASTRRANRYYVVHFSMERKTWQCSCGCNCCQHEHNQVVKDLIMNTVVLPAKPEAPVMSTPATAQEIKDSKILREASEIVANHKEGPWTAEEYKVLMRADRVRQRAWANEYREQAEALRKEAAIA